jgi:hypothetical protein
MLKSHVSCLVVCDPRKNALLKDGIESDRIDARKSTGGLERYGYFRRPDRPLCASRFG